MDDEWPACSLGAEPGCPGGSGPQRLQHNLQAEVCTAGPPDEPAGFLLASLTCFKLLLILLKVVVTNGLNYQLTAQSAIKKKQSVPAVLHKCFNTFIQNLENLFMKKKSF